jgi:hypothetical protein
LFRPNRFTMNIPVSFESGFQMATLDLYFPAKVQITLLRSIVTKALAGTDSGTIQAKNSAGSNLTNGLLTHAASAALADKQSAVPTANHVVSAGDFLRLVTAKSTAGGEALVQIEYKFVQ